MILPANSLRPDSRSTIAATGSSWRARAARTSAPSSVASRSVPGTIASLSCRPESAYCATSAVEPMSTVTERAKRSVQRLSTVRSSSTRLPFSSASAIGVAAIP